MRTSLCVLLVAVLVSGLALSAGCRGAPEAAEEEPVETGEEREEAAEEGPSVGGQLVWASIGDVSFFNPILVEDTASERMMYRIFNGLFQLNDKLELVPVLAEKFSYSDDGTEWTFELRDDVYWHDGEKFTAEDVEFTFLAMLHPAYKGVRAENYRPLRGAAEYLDARRELSKKLADGEITDEEYMEQAVALFEEWRAKGAIEVVDDYKIKFHLDEPYAPFKSYISMRIIPEHLLTLETAGDKEDPFHTDRPIGTGPFKFVEWVRDDHVTLERNEDYFDEGPYIEKIVYKIIPDQNTIAMAMETGEVDLANLKPEDFDRLKNMDHLRPYEYPALSYTYMAYNLKNPLFQDKRVRHAIAHAVDRQAVVDEVLMGHGTVCHSHGSPVLWDYNPDVRKFEYDPDKARELLAEAGWEDTDGDGVLDKNGEKFGFTIQTNQGNKVREQSAVVIQQQLADVGIDVEVKLVEWNTFVQEVLLPKNFEVVIVGWALDEDPDAYEIWHTNGGPFNFVSFSNERIDEIYELGRVTLDQEKRKALYQEAQGILAEEQPYLFLYFRNDTYCLHDRFQGPIVATPARITWNVEKWYVPEGLRLSR